MNELVRYDAACRAIAEAKSVDEAKDIRDKAVAMAAYARQAKNRDLEADAVVIRMRATRRLDQLRVAQKETVGLSRGALVGGFSKNPPIDTRPTLASQGIDKNLAHQARTLGSLSEEEFEKVTADAREAVTRATRTVVRRAGVEIENEMLRSSATVFPDGKFDVIVMDPPWPMEKIERDVRPNQVAFDYPVMSEEELTDYGSEIAPRMADDCHFYLWTTHRFLPLAVRLLGNWGVRYVCTHVWHKAGGFQPIGLPQYNCEFALYARRGTPKFVDTKAFPCCFEAPRREHSRKPDEFYQMVARVTQGRRVDWFARAPRPGFEAIGNETAKFVEVAA